MNSCIPPLLAPYIRIPPLHSLVLVTSVLGGSSNWLISQYLFVALGLDAPNASADTDKSAGKRNWGHQHTTAVVLVSWLNDWTFWRSEARRSIGLDLDALKKQGRIAFVDGLADCLGPESEDVGRKSNSDAAKSSAQLFRLHDAVLAARRPISATKVLLVLDHPSLVLHIMEPLQKSTDLTNVLLALRSAVWSCVVISPADTPLMQSAVAAVETGVAASSKDIMLQTSLEIEEAAFLVGLAHTARTILSCRRLGTGWAADVSGVVRATRGGDFKEVDADDLGDDQGEVMQVEEGEWLYHIKGDGRAKVWARGSTTGG